MGSNSERARKALDAINLLGFPKKQATPVLKRLLMLFDNKGTDEEPEPRGTTRLRPDDQHPSASASRYDMAADDDNETRLIKRPRIKGKSLEPEPPQPTVSTQADGPASPQPTRRQTRALTAAQQATDHGEPSTVVTYERDNGSLLENPQYALFLKEPKPEPAIDASTCPDVPVGPVAKQMNICSSGGKNMLIEHCKTRKMVTSGADDATGSIVNHDHNPEFRTAIYMQSQYARMGLDLQFKIIRRHLLLNLM